MSSPTQSRQPAGVPAGGQFAAGTHTEAAVSLDLVADEPVRAGDLIDYLGQFGDGDEVTLDDIEVFYTERSGGPAPTNDTDLERHDSLNSPSATDRDLSAVLSDLVDAVDEADDVDAAIQEASERIAALDHQRSVDLGDGRSINMKLTGEGLIVDVIAEGEVVATSSQVFDELADTLEEEHDPSFEAAVAQLRNAQRAVLGASTVVVAKAVRDAASNAAEIVVVADDEYPGVMYLSEVRDAAGETIGDRFDDAWVSELDDSLREHLGNASVYGDYDLTGGEQLTLDVRNLIWSS